MTSAQVRSWRPAHADAKSMPLVMVNACHSGRLGLVLMPNRVLASYTARVLPGLNLESVTVTTPEAWAASSPGLEKLEVTDRTLHLLLTDRDNERRKAAWLRANLRDLSFQATIQVQREDRTLVLDNPLLRGFLDDVLTRTPLEGYRAAFRAAVEGEILDRVNPSHPEEETILPRTLAADLTRLSGRVFAYLLVRCQDVLLAQGGSQPVPLPRTHRPRARLCIEGCTRHCDQKAREVAQSAQCHSRRSGSCGLCTV